MEPICDVSQERITSSHDCLAKIGRYACARKKQPSSTALGEDSTQEETMHGRDKL